ncbi:hypothetical protein NXS98_05670 [Fontisphaera persica]|uniref:hypothetical protein n=1 Tax=Fontisphaera persica TaxID=2974023 RepID=UPI0024BF3D09|nr:hypothetical protein [Fontisphaera persica]WCJ60618.1 hypothetical protein NXS98_05670 [Fontisphaera persica]
MNYISSRLVSRPAHRTSPYTTRASHHSKTVPSRYHVTFSQQVEAEALHVPRGRPPACMSFQYPSSVALLVGEVQQRLVQAAHLNTLAETHRDRGVRHQTLQRKSYRLFDVFRYDFIILPYIVLKWTLKYLQNRMLH